MVEGQTSRSATGNLNMTFGSFWRNDTTFGYSDVASGKAKYLTIGEEGFYKASFYITWNSDWSVGDQPYIEPSCKLGGVNSPLVGLGTAAYWDDTQQIVYGEQFTTAELDHHQLAATVWFDYTVADTGENPLGIGVNIRSSLSATKNFGAGLVVVRLGDNVSAVTIT